MRLGVGRGVWGVAIAALTLLGAPAARAQESTTVDSIVMRALDLEAAGKPREAAPLFRRALAGATPANALLGLERVYSDLGWQDSLFVPLDSLITVARADDVTPTGPAGSTGVAVAADVARSRRASRSRSEASVDG